MTEASSRYHEPSALARNSTAHHLVGVGGLAKVSWLGTTGHHCYSGCLNLAGVEESSRTRTVSCAIRSIKPKPISTAHRNTRQKQAMSNSDYERGASSSDARGLTGTVTRRDVPTGIQYISRYLFSSLADGVGRREV